MNAKSERTKERLILAAREVLLESGGTGASVKAIAQRAGVNHGLIHHYFGSKEQLFVAVVEAEAEAIHASMTTGSGMDPTRFVEGFYLPNMVGNPQRMRLIFELIGLSKQYPPVARALANVMRLRRETLRRIFRVDDPLLPILTMGAMLGMAIQASLDPDLPVDEAGERLIRLITESGNSSPAAAKSRPTSKPQRKN